ncbi:MAG: hypothetical protein ACJ8H8_29550 [Geminicoccaceae bacterium]
MKFVSISTADGDTLVVPATSIGRIVIERVDPLGDVFDTEGRRLGSMESSDALALADDAALVPASPGWWVVMAADDEPVEPASLFREAVIAWRLDYSASLGGALPITASWGTNQLIHAATTLQAEYVLLPPEGDAMDCRCTLLGGRSDKVMLGHFRQIAAARARRAA